MEQLQKKLGYTFKDIGLLKQALTHSSYANETKNPSGSNERLEFLGDSVLSIITAEYLYELYSTRPEGELTKLRAALVCEKSLCNFSISLEIGKELLLGKGERLNGGATRPSILADAFEATLAAVYLDGGIEPAKKLVLSFIIPELQNQNTEPFKDHKTTLQEIIQQNPEERLEYFLVGETGPDHAKEFVVEVRLNSNVIGKGKGRSKKDAEQQAAKQALLLMGQ